MDNSSCLTADEGRVYIALNSLFASLGALANILTIFLIVWTKAYEMHVHRLSLYLAAFSLFFSLSVGLEVVPVDSSGRSNGTVTVREGWDDACTAIGFVAQHVGLSRSLAVLGVCFYVFSLAIFEVKLKQRVYEVAGLTCVALLPALISWVPFVRRTYGLTGVWCWIGDECAAPYRSNWGSQLRLGAAVVGDVIPITISVVLIVVVAVVFCWRLRNKSGLRAQHLRALRELLPLTCYPLASAVSLFFGLINSAALHSQSRYAGEMITLCLMQTAALFLPLSFLLHPSIRRRIRIKFSKQHTLRLPPREEAKADPTTAHPHDTETSPLISQQAKQSPHLASIREKS